MKYFYIIEGTWPNGDSAYIHTLPSLMDVKRWHKKNKALTTHLHSVYKFSNGKFKHCIYKEFFGEIKIDKKSIDKYCYE